MHGDSLDPDTVNNFLKVTPHFSVKKDAVKAIRDGKQILEKTSRWEWYSEDLTKLLSIDDHISRIGIKFNDVLGEFRSIPGVTHAWLDISMIEMVKRGDTQASFILNGASTSIIGRMGIPVEFTFYALNENSDSVSTEIDDGPG